MYENKRNKTILCHLEPRAIASGCKDLFNKCRDCCEITKQKRNRVSAQKDLYGPSLRSTLKMTFLALSFLLSFNLSTVWAVNCPAGKKVCQTGCIDESLTCGYCGPTCGYTQVGGEVTLYGTGGAVSGYNHWETINGVYGLYDNDQNLNPFANNSSITSVKADSSSDFTSIGYEAFYGATALTSVDMPNVETIESEAFHGASSLTSLDMQNVITIGNEAFSGATSLTSVSMPNVTTIANGAFSNTGLTSIDIPRITSIGSGGFSYSAALEYVGLPTTTDEEGCLLNPEGQRLTTSGKSCIKSIYQGAQAFSGTSVPDCGKANAAADACGSCGSKFLKSGTGCVSKCGSGLLGKEGKCISASQGCGESFRLNDGECDRIRYTPAEAAQYLKDTDNQIIMTFKVNR